MNIENILTVLLSATIPSIVTYLVTSKNCNSKIKEVNISTEAQINQIKLQHSHEIDTLNSEHQHSIEKLEMEYKLQKETKSDDMSNKLAEMFFSGELNIDNINQSIPKLSKMKHDVDQMKNNQRTSNFINKKKRK